MNRRNFLLLALICVMIVCLAGCDNRRNSLNNTENTIDSEESSVQNDSVSTPDSDSAPLDNEVLSDSASADLPVVYMTTDISSDGMIAVYKALEASPSGKIAVKLSTGEPGSNYLRTDLIGPLVESLESPTIVECNTAYGSRRGSTATHYQLAKDHGYADIADVDIMDEDGSISLPVIGGTGRGIFGGEQNAFLESMAEAGKSVVDALDGHILYINVMNRLSVDCDCNGNPAEPDMHDIGILASFDPVALDQACVDLVYAAEDGESLINRIESRNGLHALEQAEKIGLGNREYRLVNIDG